MWVSISRFCIYIYCTKWVGIEYHSVIVIFVKTYFLPFILFVVVEVNSYSR